MNEIYFIFHIVYLDVVYTRCRFSVTVIFGVSIYELIYDLIIAPSIPVYAKSFV